MINVRDNDFLNKFGRNLRRIRNEKKVSQEALSNKANITPSQVGRIERGESNPTISTVLVIAQALEVDLDILFGFNYSKKQSVIKYISFNIF